jgi:hypothetical protein
VSAESATETSPLTRSLSHAHQHLDNGHRDRAYSRAYSQSVKSAAAGNGKRRASILAQHDTPVPDAPPAPLQTLPESSSSRRWPSSTANHHRPECLWGLILVTGSGLLRLSQGFHEDGQD